MGRNDASLYTGLHSSSFARKRQQNQEKLEKQSKFVKDAPFVFEEIAKQQAELGEVLNSIVNGDDYEEEIMVKLQAVRLHRKWLSDLEARLKIVLRAKPLKTKKEKDEANI